MPVHNPQQKSKTPSRLLENQHLSMLEQPQPLEKSFIEWKGAQEQLDDVIFIGIQF